jgi:FkbM family methyltransferase
MFNISKNIQKAMNYRKVYKNYLNVFLQLFFKKEASLQNDKIMIKVILKDGTKLSVPYGWVVRFAEFNMYKNANVSNLTLTENGIFFHYKGIPVIIDPGRFSDPESVFLQEDYKFLDVKDRDVIDVGMNIGDSTIYFALNGAKRVIGLEPYPYAFAIAEKNIRMNNIQNAILLNAGYGRDTKICVDEKKITGSSAGLIPSKNGGKEIPIYSLKTLFNTYDIKEAILKMDCEGCEYDLLYEDNETLKKLLMIQIEYHYGYEKLKEKLESAGFKVQYTEPRKKYNPYASNPNMVLGYIYAVKN